MDDKTRENRIRRKLDRMGYRLIKSRRKDPDAIDYGLYMIVDVDIGGAVFGISEALSLPDATLDEVEEWIRADTEENKA